MTAAAAPGAVRRVGTVAVWGCVCQRCGHKWQATGDEPPEWCAGCGSRYWKTKPGTLPRGRPPGRKAVAK